MTSQKTKTKTVGLETRITMLINGYLSERCAGTWSAQF